VEIGQLIDLLRARRRLALLSILLCTAAAAALAWTRPPTYLAKAQLFVSTNVRTGEIEQAFEGERYAQQRARSYAQIVSSARGAELVIESLGLSASVGEIDDKIRASVAPNSVVIDVSARDRSAELATAMATALAEEIPRLADRLERAGGSGRSPIEVTGAPPAEPPASPASPRKPLYVALGAVLGLALGIGSAALLQHLDRRVRSGDELRGPIGPRLGTIPRHSGNLMPVIVADPFSAAAEQYRALRTNIQVLRAEHGLASLFISSPAAGDGKTEVTANLGLALAEVGERVVAVDANLRASRLGALLGASPGIGLTDVLARNDPIELALQSAPSARAGAPLEVINSGSPRLEDSELLTSERFGGALTTLMERCDVVLVDCPAIDAADAMAIAGRASGVILVARSGSTTTDELAAASRQLRAAGAHLLGVVLNGARNGRMHAYRGDAPRRGPTEDPRLVGTERGRG
jgi:capsular exopolysaccharide synthesis family protein